MDARDAAKHLIRVYVERGDSSQSRKESLMDRYGRDYRAGIGTGGSSTICPAKNLDSITVCHRSSFRICG